MWMMILKYLKQGWALLLSLGASLVTFLLMRSRQNKKEKIEAQKRYERAVDIAKKDIEIDREHDSRAEDIARDLEKKKTLGELSNPNDW